MNAERSPIDDVWDDLWNFAHTVCAEIESWQPDLILVLHKSGAVPWHAAETLWRLTRSAPLPPLATANIGREKACFEEAEDFNELDYSGEWDRTRCMVGAMAQPGWVEALCAQVAATAGPLAAAPHRILLVDDVINDGYTGLIALGLLWAAYPQAHARLLAGMSPNWREIAGWGWLRAQHPEVEAHLYAWGPQAKAAANPNAGPYHPSTYWQSIISGLADEPADPFAAVTMTRLPTYLDHLTNFLPLTAWLECAGWLRTRVTEEIARRVAAQRPASTAITTKSVSVPAGAARPTRRLELSPTEQVWLLAWTQRAFTAADAAARIHLPLDEAEALLDALTAKGVVQTVAGQPAMCYTLAPDEGALIYDLLVYPIGADEVLPAIVDCRPATTPFPVEFAAVDFAFGGGPALAGVKESDGAPVPAVMLGLDRRLKDPGEYLLEVRAAAEPYMAGDDYVARSACKVSCNFGIRVAGVHPVFAVRKPTLIWALDPALPVDEKAERLTDLAVASLSAETYRSGMDALTYLADALERGVNTPLTQPFVAAVLRRAGGAESIAAARDWFARRQGW